MPFFLLAKLLIQEMWVMKSDWYHPLVEKIQSKFKKCYNALQAISEFKLPL